MFGIHILALIVKSQEYNNIKSFKIKTLFLYFISPPESNPGGGQIFRCRRDQLWGPPSLLYNRYRVFPGGKAAGTWRWQPTPSSAEVKERVWLNLYPPQPTVGLYGLFSGELYLTFYLSCFSAGTCLVSLCHCRCSDGFFVGLRVHCVCFVRHNCRER